MEEKTAVTASYDEKFYKAIDQISEILAEEERDSYQSPLESFEAYKARQKEVIKMKFEELRVEYFTAYEVIFEYLIGNQSTQIILTRSEKEEILNEIKRGEKNLAKVLEDPPKLEHFLNEGHTFQDILGYSKNTLEKFYFVGLECLEAQEYRKAKEVFILLTLINPGYHNFWVSLALCFQALGDWNSALQSCSVAEAIDETDPMPYLYASECYAGLKDKAHALEKVNKAIEHFNGQAKFAEVKRMAEEWKEQLLKTA